MQQPSVERKLTGGQRLLQFFRRRPILTGVLAAPALVVVLIGAWLVVGHRRYRIPSSSMEPGLMGPAQGQGYGDMVQVDVFAPHYSRPARGEIWMFRAPEAMGAGGKLFLKRIIGLPGETIEVAPPRIEVDGNTAICLTQAGAYNTENQAPGLSLWGDETPQVDAGGRVVRFGFPDVGTQIIASKSPQIRLTDRGVEVDGVLRLKRAETPVQEVSPELGSDPVVRVRAFARASMSDSPELLVVQGQQLAYRPGEVRINGAPIRDYTPQHPGYAMPPVKLGEDEYFVLGDNRNNSNDSHVWGPLKREYLAGRADFRLWPLHRFSPL